jgi:hypothetical protein
LKRLLLIGSLVTVISLLIVGFAIPLFAHDSDDDGAKREDEATWEVMHEACEEGDWEAMIEAAEELHGEDSDLMPYHDEGHYHDAQATHYGWGGMGGHMGRGMMGW